MRVFLDSVIAKLAPRDEHMLSNSMDEDCKCKLCYNTLVRLHYTLTQNVTLVAFHTF